MSIICVYNNKKILEENLIKSLEKQNMDYELILVDNRKNEFSSASSALNYGSSLASGDYFVFAHQDIYLSHDDWIEKTISTLALLDNIGIVGVAGKTKDSLVRGNIKHGLDSIDVTPYKIDESVEASTLDECLLIIPKSVFEKHKFNTKRCPDWHLYGVDYVYNIKEKGFTAYIMPTMLEHKSKGASMSEGYYKTLPKLQKKYLGKILIRTCMGDWFTFVPVKIQRFIKKYKKY